jgi:hypothetical protein
LVIFLIITLVFGFLQFRVVAIGSAVDRRTQALQRLRSIKAKQLSGDMLVPNVLVVVDDDEQKKNDSSDNDKVNLLVQQATEEYREALEEVERLRTIIPGFARIAPPPAPTAIMEENVAAAKQFLGIDLKESSRSLLLPRQEQDTEKTKQSRDQKVEQNQEQQQQQNSLSSPVLIAVLVAVGISQIALLFLLSLDPMMPSSNIMP